MDVIVVTRNFKVKGTIRGMFTPDGGAPTAKYIANMQVELWYKGPMEIVYLGSGATDENGDFLIEFDCESPSSMVVNGKINNVFVKVIYNNQVVTGDLDSSGGSFD
jgi:hypothetical protein